MKAVVLHEYGGPEKLKFEDNVPDPQINGDTVLIAAAAASVNPIDWKLRSGMRRKDSPLSFPAILGRDVSGVVRAVGAYVKHFKTGDRVWSENWICMSLRWFHHSSVLAIIGFETQRVFDPFRFLLIAVSGWMNQRQLRVIDYLREENRVLREQLGVRRLRLNDHQRRRLAAKAKVLGRKVLDQIATIVTPETLLA